MINVFLRHRLKIVGLPLAFAGIAVIGALLWPASFTSSAEIMPQTEGGISGQLSQLTGVASQFGMSLPSGAPGQSPQFYANLLTSQRLLEEAVSYRYGEREAEQQRSSPPAQDGAEPSTREEKSTSASEQGGETLVELYDVEGDSQAERVFVAAKELEEDLAVSTNTETGVVEMSVTTAWPSVSKGVARRLVELVNQFNNRVRQSQASEEAEFVGQRLKDVRRELRGAEDRMESFLESNVGWQQSPELRFQHDRLQRRVSLKQQVYTSLATRYEEARISEVKSTPVVTTVTQPQLPVKPDPKYLPLKAALGLVVGGLIGVLWAFGAAFTTRARQENTEDYRQFVSLKESMMEDIRNTRRAFGRPGAGSPGGEDTGS